MVNTGTTFWFIIYYFASNDTARTLWGTVALWCYTPTVLHRKLQTLSAPVGQCWAAVHKALWPGSLVLAESGV
jgi:hypothetical protein